MQPGEPQTKKRRSLFDFEPSDPKDVTFKFTEQTNGISYPTEYIDKVKSEIEEWKLRITEALEEKQSFKKAKSEFEKKVYDESVLSEEQLTFLSYDSYLERVYDFCNQIVILRKKFNRQDQLNELKTRCVDTQKKIDDIMFSKV